MTQQPPPAPREERDDHQSVASAIPGAWVQPAAAFADESSVVRPDRRDAGGASGRVVRLLVLAVLSAGTAAFAWGVTVALQSLDDEEAAALPSVASGASPARAATDPAEAVSAPSPASDAAPLTVVAAAIAEEGAAERALEGEPPVPAADPSFPALPPPSDDVGAAPGDDIPAPKRLRAARASSERDDEVKPRMARYERDLKKRQRLARAHKRRASARRQSAPDDPAPTTTAAASAAPESAARAPVTAASLTREAERLFAAGELREARALAERALEESRGYPRAHRALAVICAKQGDSACARKGYETYLKLAPGAPDAPDVRRILGM